MSETLLLIGCGKMGTALLAGWIAQGLTPSDAYVVEADTAAHARIRPMGVHVVAGPETLPHGLAPSIIVLAVKPQSMDQVVPAYAGPAATALTISIAAGKSIAYFEKLLGESRAIVRVMPNTPAAVGRGMSVCVANTRTSAAQRERTSELMAAVGDVAWIDDESLMDAVTAVSGSGPAYVFLLAECLGEAGRAAGLPEELAQRLARATVAGAGELLARSPESPAVLRRNVTSPGGTTAAALDVLLPAGGDGGLRDLMTRAVAAATRRGKQLAG